MTKDGLLARLFAVALLGVVICNGASVYLKRTGVLEHDAYQRYWSYHCFGSWDDPAGPREPQCDELTSRAASEKLGLPAPGVPADYIYRYVYELSPAQRALKALKDGLMAGMLVAGLWALRRSKPNLPDFRRPYALSLFAMYSAGSLLASVALNGMLVAASGARGLLTALIALTGRWAVAHLGDFAIGVAALLLVQAALVPFELLRGIHMFHEWSSLYLASRVAGTLTQPNSMGVFAVAAFLFYEAFGTVRSGKWLFILGVAAAGLVFFSGSATGMVCAALAGAWMARRRMQTLRTRRVTFWGVLILAVVLALLPALTGRQDVFESLSAGGRLTAFAAALFDRPLANVLLGSGLGVNTNLALNLAGLAMPAHPAAVPTDSALTGLLIQVGVAGTLLFYGALWWAARRDREAQIFYAAIALSTLTINVMELFPVNLLLGLAWAHSLWRPSVEQQGEPNG